MLAEYQQRFAHTNEQLGQSQQVIRGLRSEQQKTQQTLDRLRQAFTGEERKEVDDGKSPAERHYEAQLDKLLAIAVQAERDGRPIPVTVENGVQSYQGLIQKEREIQALNRQLAEQKKRIDRLDNPDYQLDQAAAAQLDASIHNALNTIYGESADLVSVKGAQFRTVSQTIMEDVKDMAQNDPQLWDRVRRNPSDIKKLVNYHVEQSIPPRARQLMEEDRIRRTPLTRADLVQAWNEAKAMQPSEQRDKIIKQLRTDLVAQLHPATRAAERRAQGSGDMSLSDLFRQGR